MVIRRDDEWPAFLFIVSESGSGWVPDRCLSTDDGRARVLIEYDTTELCTRRGELLEVILSSVPRRVGFGVETLEAAKDGFPKGHSPRSVPRPGSSASVPCHLISCTLSARRSLWVTTGMGHTYRCRPRVSTVMSVIHFKGHARTSAD